MLSLCHTRELPVPGIYYTKRDPNLTLIGLKDHEIDIQFFGFCDMNELSLQILELFYHLVNNDTKHLNKLIASERGVWHAFSTLAYDQNEAAKYLSVWGKSEDVDLTDVTEKVSYLITKLSEAEGVLANHYSQYRSHLKEIRLREDSMREQRAKKETLWSKLEKEERKSNPSKPETSLADFKRKELHGALTAQFDAFLEFGEKLVIISKHCKKIIDQIPVTETRPGEPREQYRGKEITKQAVADAKQALENWALPNENTLNYLTRPRTTISDDSTDDPLSTQKTNFSTPPQDALNSENTDDFSFNPSERKSLTPTFSGGISSSNTKYFEDPNEADHSDLDQTTDAEGEMSRVKGNIPLETTANSITDAAVINLIPKPPTPPPKKDVESELTRTVGEPTKAQFIATEQVAELSNTLEIDNDSQHIDSERLAPDSSSTRSQRKELKHVHFSDVESEIP
ncbi:15842_t:CDS:2 [Gigaspora margarita]|uniref:15842_t:CDS:1 n=1 Tax=Gigaspora margarita TaxID=4874 RepID=A0ABM8W435_GIGMA|nr:15842_t:CDS:2 [Gigaspora margarita]